MPPSSQALPVALLAGAASATQCCLCTCISAESTPASNRHGRQVNTHHRLPRFPALAVCCYNTLSSCCSLLRHRSCGTERMHAHAVHARDASWQYRRLQQGTRCVANSYALEELVGGSGHTQLLLEQLSMDLDNRAPACSSSCTLAAAMQLFFLWWFLWLLPGPASSTHCMACCVTVPLH